MLIIISMIMHDEENLEFINVEKNAWQFFDFKIKDFDSGKNILKQIHNS